MTPSRTAISSQSTPLAGIAWVVAAVGLFSIYNALTKWLAADYSVWQIMFFRGLVGLLPFLVYGLIVAGPAAVRSTRPRLQLLRAGFGLASNLLFILAFRELPLAEAMAIGFAAPIFVVVLSVPLLSERVGVQRASAAVVGFVGILLIAQPSAGVFSAGALYALGGTFFYALVIVTTRRVGATDGALCTVVYTSASYGLASALVVPFVWVPPDAADLALLIGLGAIGSTAMLLFAHAYRQAQAAVLAPFDYTALLWAGLIGFVIWADVPSPLAIFGMAVVAGSGLFLMRHERQRRFTQEKL